MELSFPPPGGSFEKDQGKWQGTGKKGEGGVKLIPTKPEMRLSPSATGKEGELEDSRLRLAKTI